MARITGIICFITSIWLILPNYALAPESAGYTSESSPGEDSPAYYVSEEFLNKHLLVLAHDTLHGRGTGQAGSRMTADYLHEFYANESFTDSGFEVKRQPFALEGNFWSAVDYSIFSIQEEDTLYKYQSKVAPGIIAGLYPLIGGTGLIEAPIVFAGFGSYHENYGIRNTGHPDLEGSWKMIFGFNDDQEHDEQDRHKVNRSEYVRNATGFSGARGVIFISEAGIDHWDSLAYQMSHQMDRPLAVRKSGQLRRGQPSFGNAVTIHPDLAAGIMGFSDTDQLDSLRQAWKAADHDRKPMKTDYYLRNKPVTENRSFEEHNILAILPGYDRELKDEVLILTAHYDHMGRGEPDDRNDIIYNGADDNASGTSVLLQVAEAFKRAAENGYRPSRTIMFLHVAAEEWGLLGSRYYVQNPVISNENIVANINVDMVGHIDNVYNDREETDYVYVLGAGLISSGLQKLVEQANEASVNLILDETYNSTSHPYGLYRRSDHWAFGEQNIPFVFFFSGLHDNYHVPSDTPDRIAWSLLTDRAKLVTELVWRLAESSGRPLADQDLFENRR